jgi:hypothetical protein
MTWVQDLVLDAPVGILKLMHERAFKRMRSLMNQSCDSGYTSDFSSLIYPYHYCRLGNDDDLRES